MTGWLDKFLNTNKPDITEALGNVEDYIRTPNDYEEAMTEINQRQAEKQKVQKFWDIANRLGSIDYDSVPKTKKIESTELNPDHRDFQMMDKSSNPAVQSYYKYIQDLNEKNDDGTPKYKDVKANDFQTFLEMNPELQESIGPQHYRPRTDEAVLTPEEYQLEAYKMAGLDDNDIKFYAENKNTIDNISDWNKKVQNMLYSMATGIKPKFGKRDLSGNVLQQGSDLLLPEAVIPKHKYSMKEVGNKLLRWDEATGNYKVIDVPQDQEETSPDDWEHFIDEDGSKTGETGTVYWGERVKDNEGKWNIVFRSKLNEQEMKDYQNGEDKKNKEGVYASKKKTGSKRYSSKKKRIGEKTPEELKNVRLEDLDNMSVDDLEALYKKKNYLKPSVQEELEKRKEGESQNTEFAEESDQGTWDYFAKYAGEIDDAYKSEDKTKFNSLQDSFLADLEKYKAKLSESDYQDFKDAYYKY